MSSNKKISLVDLGKNIDLTEPAAETPQPVEAKAAEAVKVASSAPEPKRAKTPAASSNGGGAPGSLKSVEQKSSKPAARPRLYDQLDRKEARLRSEQYRQLTDLSRDLNRRRNREGDRITENTLIRVAIDMLLSKQADLAGATEEDLRRSVGL